MVLGVHSAFSMPRRRCFFRLGLGPSMPQPGPAQRANTSSAAISASWPNVACGLSRTLLKAHSAYETSLCSKLSASSIFYLALRCRKPSLSACLTFFNSATYYLSLYVLAPQGVSISEMISASDRCASLPLKRGTDLHE